MTRLQILLLSPILYILLSITVCWVLKKILKGFKPQFGVKSFLVWGFVFGTLLSVMTVGLDMIWAPVIFFGLCFIAFLFIGLIEEFTPNNYPKS